MLRPAARDVLASRAGRPPRRVVASRGVHLIQGAPLRRSGDTRSHSAGTQAGGYSIQPPPSTESPS